MHDPFTSENPLDIDPSEAVGMQEASTCTGKGVRQVVRKKLCGYTRCHFAAESQKHGRNGVDPRGVKNYRKNNPHLANPEKDPVLQYLEDRISAETENQNTKFA